MRVLFAGTPDFAVPPLQALAQEHNIVGVFTQPDRRSGRGKKLTPSPVKLTAQTLGITTHQPQTLKNQADVISALVPDIMVVVAYGMLLPQNILDIPNFGCLNIHASLLPRWRGAAPIHRAIEAGDTQSGVAIMKMELGLDTGPVYQVLNTPITDTDTTASLHDRLAELGATGICQTLTALQENPELVPQEQDDSLACYAKKISKSEAHIDWSADAKSIHQKIRAFIPYPIAQCQHHGTRLRIWQAKLLNNNESHAAAGVITEVNDQGIVVQCGQGTLLLETLQRDGSKALPWRQFANGYSMNPGESLS